ncbi:MAG: DUF924 family protein [Cellvibrionaceae bacterium]
MENHLQSSACADEVLKFWFDELEPKQHFIKDSELDTHIRDRFGDLLMAALACELWPWRSSANGRLAEVIVLDQFSRNVYRDQPQAFEGDRLALCLAQEAIALGVDQQLPATRRSFLYMPFMHSESLLIQAQSVDLFSQPGLAQNLEFAHRHRDIIERFGRYPHRNQLLNRQSSPEELAFLCEPGSSF